EFGLTAVNAAAVAAICVRLDGLPLAIELAAARVRLLSPSAIRDRLTQRLALLTSGARDRPERHRTLRAALAWSYDLLTPAEQAVLQRLAVFVGGCSVEAAEAVCTQPHAEPHPPAPSPSVSDGEGESTIPGGQAALNLPSTPGTSPKGNFDNAQ